MANLNSKLQTVVTAKNERDGKNAPVNLKMTLVAELELSELASHR